MSNPQRDEIIRRLDLLAEFEKYGGRVPANRPSISQMGGCRSIPSTEQMSIPPLPST